MAIEVYGGAEGVEFKEGKKKSRAFLKHHKSTLRHINEPEAKKTLVEQLIKEASVATGQLSSSVERISIQDRNISSLSKGFLGYPFKGKQYHMSYRESAKVIPKGKVALFIIQNLRFFLYNNDRSKRELEERFCQEYGFKKPIRF